jgi:crossover junction endodeoxyribonuclease RuvC
VVQEIILGIDPGTIKTGFGLIEKREDGSISHISHGTVFLDGKLPLAERIRDLSGDLVQIIGKYQPNSAAIEEAFFYKNAKTALALGQARGAIMAVLGLHGLKIHSFTPTAVKLSITGSGKAQKFQVAHLVARILNISTPKHQDASDALALALAYAQRNTSFPPRG